jgi:hypothetical protein
MFTGIVGSHPEGVLSIEIYPTSLCICRGSALIQHPMLDVYCNKGGRSSVGRRVILHLPVISTNRVLVFVSTTCVALAGVRSPWNESRNGDEPCWRRSAVPICHLSGGIMCSVQHRSTIQIVGGAVRTSLLVAE